MSELEMIRLRLDQLLTRSMWAYVLRAEYAQEQIEAKIRELTSIEARLIRESN